MKKYVNIIAYVVIIAALALCAFSVHAAEVDTSGLTQKQIAEIQALAAQTKASNIGKFNPDSIQDENFTPEKFKEWVDAGTAVGKGFVAVAKELGVEANNFATTPLGKISVALLIWNFFGSEVVGYFLGFFFMILGTMLWFYMFRRMCLIKGVVYTPTDKKNWYGRTISEKKVEYYTRVDDIGDTRVGMILLLCVIWLASITIIVAQ